jgi:hypothetical protein
MNGELRWRGSIIISVFGHHNITEGAVSIVHEITGSRGGGGLDNLLMSMAALHTAPYIGCERNVC